VSHIAVASSNIRDFFDLLLLLHLHQPNLILVLPCVVYAYCKVCQERISQPISEDSHRLLDM
jgi:hypothetical protein